MTSPNRAARPPTIYEVAERAGVSIATVSHALNRPERVSERTRRKFLDSADELGFVPRGRSRSARPLRRIVVWGPFSEHPTYVTRLLGLLTEAADEMDVVVVDDLVGRDEPVVHSLPVRGAYDGVTRSGIATSSGPGPVVCW